MQFFTYVSKIGGSMTARVIRSVRAHSASISSCRTAGIVSCSVGL